MARSAALGRLLLGLWGTHILSKTVDNQGITFPTKSRGLSAARGIGPVGGQRTSRYKDAADNNMMTSFTELSKPTMSANRSSCQERMSHWEAQEGGTG